MLVYHVGVVLGDGEWERYTTRVTSQWKLLVGLYPELGHGLLVVNRMSSERLKRVLNVDVST